MSLLYGLRSHLIAYPTPVNLSFYWNLGFLSGICWSMQIATGIFLASYYQPSFTQAFDCIHHIMRDVVFGWFFRYMHANGASLFFIVLYLHMSKALLLRSYSSVVSAWLYGFILLFLLMGTAFLGYILPMGQMSLAGATVITNLLSSFPFVGSELVRFVWGGFSVGSATLNRFYMLHFLLPLVTSVVIILHLFALHASGSSHSHHISYRQYSFLTSFYSNFVLKDSIGLVVFLLSLFYLVGYLPNSLGHTDNYIEANPLVTPLHIVPEFYFLPYYAILRSFPHKGTGILAMVLSLVIVLVLPVLSSSSKSSLFSRSYTLPFFFLFLLLTILGALPISYPYPELGLVSSLLYYVSALRLPVRSFYHISYSSPLRY